MKRPEVIRSYRDLIVWQKSMELVVDVYRVSKLLPKDERFGLIPQLRRSAVSVPSNIAEGYGRNSSKDYIRFLQISRGSLFELQTQLEICLSLGYISNEEHARLSDESSGIAKMLNALVARIPGSR